LKLNIIEFAILFGKGNEYEYDNTLKYANRMKTKNTEELYIR
jgi:hypothetical protein